VHLQLAQPDVKEGISDAGGVPIEFPLHPIFRELPATDRGVSTATWPISAWSRSSTAIRSTPSC
jgi:hypothetical protein